MFEEIKKKHYDIIMSLGTYEPWVKMAIINVLDEQISKLPELDQQRYIIYLKSAEHKDGFKLGMEAHPVLRIKGDNMHLEIVRDSGHNPDSFFWDTEMYEKMKRKSVCYFIGSDTGVYLENCFKIRSRLNDDDGRQLSNKIASSKHAFEVMESPAEQRYGVEVTPELIEALPELLESYNDSDASKTVKLLPGDLLVLDGNGFFYRVEKSLKEQTYYQGVLD